MALDLVLAAAAAAAQAPAGTAVLQPAALLGLLGVDTAADVSAKAVAAIADLLLQPPPRQQTAAAGAAASGAAGGSPADDAVVVHISTSGAVASDPMQAQRSQRWLHTVHSQPAGKGGMTTDPATAGLGAGANLLRQEPPARSLPAEVLSALLAALARPDAAAVRAAAAAALRQVVAASAAAHVSDLEPRPAAASVAAAGQAAADSPEAAGEAEKVSVRLAVAHEAEPGGASSGGSAVRLTLKVGIASAAGGTGASRRQAPGPPPARLDIQADQLADVALAAAQAASDVDGTVAAAAATLLADVAPAAALALGDAAAVERLCEPAWRFQVRNSTQSEALARGLR